MVNRLATESSPYLQQHAENPVNWYPWGQGALDLAAEQDKPILLSVGYSACHWCHVMAHESFEDERTAAIMNRSFVNVKVDREERPDIDALYMEAVQALSGQGGWPMTVVMTPSGEPFFAGTYFPPTPRHGLPAFGDMLDAISYAWEHEKEGLVERATQVTSALREWAQVTPGHEALDRDLVSTAVEELLRSFDPVNGGFGSAPKFPSAVIIDVLFRHHIATGDTASLDAAVSTLDHMAAGGIFDHLGGGFARYSTDDRWLVPHFEKMLYDNAQLITAYVHGWQLTGSRSHLRVVDETVTYVLRDLRLDGGGFASAEDADTEGEEGRFYVWTEDELADVLTPDELDAARGWYGVTDGGNFGNRSNVLFRPDVAVWERPKAIEAIREKLFNARLGRERPGVDDKVLTEWNALMIAALAEAGAAAGRTDWVDAAVEAMEFLEAHLLDDDRWYRSWQQASGRKHRSYSADYAALIDAYTRLGEATGQKRWHLAALRTSEQMLDLFWDTDHSGLFTTGRDGEELLVQRKEFFDSPVPSSNANAAVVLQRVGIIHGRDDIAGRGRELMTLLTSASWENPAAHARMLAAVDLAFGPTSEIVVAGDSPDLLATVRQTYLPNSVILHGERFESPLWNGREDGRAYVCKNYTCALPAADVDELGVQLARLAG